MTDPSPDPPLEDGTLWRLYGFAVDEYRFQVNLNWQRLQYFLGLNVAILGVGTGLLRVGIGPGSHPDDTLPGLVFIAGVLLAGAAFYLARRQHDYYRSARNRMTDLSRQLGVHHLAVTTTAGARGEQRRRWTKVQTVNEAVLVALGVLNAIGAGYALSR